MKVTMGENGLTKTWQDTFPKTVKCVCGGECQIGFVAHEGLDGNDPSVLDKRFVANLHKTDGKKNLWLHDCCAVAVYFCRGCLQAKILYNQG